MEKDDTEPGYYLATPNEFNHLFEYERAFSGRYPVARFITDML